MKNLVKLIEIDPDSTVKLILKGLQGELEQRNIIKNCVITIQNECQITLDLLKEGQQVTDKS
jgi:hypothetical protein